MWRGWQRMSTRPGPNGLIRALNACGSALARRGLPSLNPERLLARAGWLPDPEDPATGADWIGALHRLVVDLEDGAQLSLAGRLAARHHLVALIANRLRIEADFRRHAAIGAQAVPAPLFIVGLPRTGTTLLHMLLAQDPEHRVPTCWEVMYPCPASGTIADRKARAARQIDWMERLAPGFRVLHPLAAELPQECIAIDSYTLESFEFQTTHQVPRYQAWLESRDRRPAYRFHRRFLQYLQWQRPGGRWILKAPAHLFSLDALLTVYPDAGIIQTHRNPLEVMASLASLSTRLRSAFSDHVDPHQVGREMSARWSDGLSRALAARDNGRIRVDRVIDIDYRQLVADPFPSIEAIYQRFGLALRPSAIAAMGRFLRRNPKDRHGRHLCSLEEYGLDEHREAQRFAAYRARFHC